MSVVLRRGSIAHGCISRRGTISSCQSAVTSKIVERCCSRVFSCKQRYIKYPGFTFLLPFDIVSRHLRSTDSSLFIGLSYMAF